MVDERFCDGCGKGCPLDAPSCELGRAIAAGAFDEAFLDEVLGRNASRGTYGHAAAGEDGR